MNMIRKKLIICVMCLLFVFLTFTGNSYAWLGLDQNTVVTSISGSLVTEYFHCGSGSKDDPFVITRPIHYYHMVEFFQRLTSLPVVYDGNQAVVKFGEEYLYFQIGCSEERLYDPTLPASKDDGQKCYVYEYSNSGEIQKTDGVANKSTTLNMAYYSGDMALMPVGSSEIPFYGSLDGKGITVSNLNIIAADTVLVNGITETSRSTSDIGIFGYVYDSSTIQNVYYSDVTINIDGAGVDADAVTTATSHDDEHDGKIYVGYLCGHIHNYYDDTSAENATASGTATPFSNVYLDNCNIVGGEFSSATVADDYGYYGHVDNQNGSLAEMIAEMEKKKGAGDDYSFIFNAVDVYNFLGSLDTSKSLITRNWGESGQGSTLSDSISYNSSYSYYQLVGKSPDTTSASYDYSFDTIGYSGETNYYDLYYKNGSYVSLPSDVTITNTKPDPTDSTLTDTGKYIYNAGSNYKYYEVTQGYTRKDTEYAVYYYDNDEYKALSESTVIATSTAPKDQTEKGAFVYYDKEKGEWVYYIVTTAYSNGTSDAYYPLYYYDQNTNTYTKIEADKVIMSEPSATCATVGTAYLYYKDSQWNYSVCTSASEEPETFGVTFTSNNNPTFTASVTTTSSSTLSSTTLSKTSVAGTLYIDGVKQDKTVTINLTAAGKRTSTSRRYTYTGTVTAEMSSFTVEGLTAGTHKYAVLADVSGITCTFKRSNGNTITSATTAGYIYCGGTVTNNSLTQTTAEVTSTSNSVSLTLAYSSSSLTCSDTSKGNFATATDAVFSTYPVYSNTGVYYSSAGDKEEEGPWEQYIDSAAPVDRTGYKCRKATITTEPQESVYIQYELFYGDDHASITDSTCSWSYGDNTWKCIMSEITKAVISGPYDVYYNDGTYALLTAEPTLYNGAYKYASSGDTYIADAFSSYVSYTDDDDNVWRYSADNMDIVGGLQFYSSYVYMNGYAKNTKTLTSSSLGTTFYGHAQCQDSILLYIKNVKGLEDTDSIGTITAYYDKYDGNNTAEDSMRLNRYQMSSDSDTNASRGFSTSLGCSTVTKTISGTSRTGYSASLTRAMLEQVAYCGIDADGNIVCIPNTSDLTMIYADGKTSDDVAYYVLFLGVSSGHLQVYEIEFEYKAQHGVGTEGILKPLISENPIFRYVDYRDASDIVGNSLINMSWTMPSGANDSNFSVETEYSPATVTLGTSTYHYYTITVNNTTGNSMDLSVILFDDDADEDNEYIYAYKIIYNGNVVTNSAYTTDSSAQEYWQASHTHTLPAAS